MTEGLDPRFWVGRSPALGSCPDEELIWLEAAGLAKHAAVIAQSGSGKSFFLGRLIEEILVSTLARCVILDPNSDYRYVHQVGPEKIWTDAGYDPLRRRGYLPHEGSREEFEQRWSRVSKAIYTLTLGGHDRESPKDRESPLRPLQLPMTALSPDLLAGDSTFALRSKLDHCALFTKALSDVLEIRRQVTGSAENLAELSQEFIEEDDDDGLNDRLVELSALGEIARSKPRKGRFPFLLEDIFNSAHKESVAAAVVRDAARRMKISRRYARGAAAEIYFSQIRRLELVGLVDPTILVSGRDRRRARLEVVDLPSVRHRVDQLVAVSAFLADEWDHSLREWEGVIESQDSEATDSRVPTFIVVDEAHNLAPAEVTSAEQGRVRDQLRTIVAEGRKYGQFLVLVTQRPDKIDPLLVTECENRAVMRLSSAKVVELARQLLSLEHIPDGVVRGLTHLPVGRALLTGPWVGESVYQQLYVAARRTREGGGNLSTRSWAQVP